MCRLNLLRGGTILILFLLSACYSTSLSSNSNPTKGVVQNNNLPILSSPAAVTSDKPTGTPASSIAPVSISTSTSTFTPTPTAIPSPTPTPFGGGTGKIAFIAAGEDHSSNIYLMNVDGTEFIQLTHNSEIKCCLAWSPDGQKLVFKADRDIYLVNADGNNLTKLVDITPTDGDGDWHDFPVWSPDSQQILFASYYLSPHLNLTTPADGGLTGLTNAPIFPEMGHTWSPDGQHIAFTSGHDDESEIYVINATDTNLTKLTNNTVKDWGPVWSPDGQSIAFISEQQDELAEIYLTHADGSNQRRLTESSGRYTGNPVWSPDSHHIAYTSQHLNDDEWIYWIHIINAAGTGQQQLVKGTEPAWSPDGQYIVFVDVDLKISVMDAGGVQAIKLPIPLPYTAAPTWQPSPPRLWGSDKVFDDKAWSPTPTVLPEVAAIPVTSTQSFRLDEFSPRLIDDDSERIYTTGYVDGIDNPQTLVLNLADERLLARYDIAGGLALDTGCVQKFR